MGGEIKENLFIKIIKLKFSYNVTTWMENRSDGSWKFRIQKSYRNKANIFLKLRRERVRE